MNLQKWYFGARRCVLSAAVIGALICLLAAPMTLHAQGASGAGAAATPAPAIQDPTIHTTIDAAESDGDEPARKLVHWNEYEGKYFTARLGGGLLYDYSGYAQDDSSKGQLILLPKIDLRDFRVLLKGRFKFAPRLTYTLGYMYDKAKDDFRFRQTGLMVDVPELLGHVFIGRTKEGFSTSKIMVGYQGWTMERSVANDAFLPILADGIKWTGNSRSGKLVYNLGWFVDTLSESESFNKNDKQFAGRAVWLPFAGKEKEKGVLHFAFEERYAASNDGFLRYRSKPESYEAQNYAVDTGKFAAQNSNTMGIEAYYRPGPLMFGMEYLFNKVGSRETNNPFFHGGDVFVAHLLTGETRPYNSRGAYFDRISPKRTVFDGGPGAWELVLRYSYADLDSGPIQGGKFWRITPLVNWHLNDNLRLEFVTGYGRLDRFGTTGGLFFAQTRLQMQL